MRRHSILAAMVLASPLVLATTSPAAEPAVKSLDGSIAAVDAQSKIVTVDVAPKDGAAKQSMTVTIDAATKIVKSGRPMELAELQKGDRVVITYRLVSGAAVAVTIGVQEPDQG